MTAAFVPGTWLLPQVRQPRAGDVQQAADGCGGAQALISTFAVGAALLSLSAVVRAWLKRAWLAPTHLFLRPDRRADAAHGSRRMLRLAQRTDHVPEASSRDRQRTRRAAPRRAAGPHKRRELTSHR